MTRSISAATTAFALTLTAVSCGHRAGPNDAARERAYAANNVGVADLEQFKYDEAAAEFRRALTLDPSVAMARANLSIALFLAQDLAGATREATESVRLLPATPQGPYVLGLAAQADGRNADAAGFFQRVLQLDPGDVGAKVNLAQVKLQDRQAAEAIALLRSAVADEAYNVTAVYSLGLALTRAGQRDEGQRFLTQSQELRKTGYATSYGTQYLEQGRYAEAIASTGAEPELVDPSVSPAKWTADPPIAGASPGDAPSPYGRSFEPATLTPESMRGIAAGLGGAVTLIDVDRDGQLDAFLSAPSGQRLLRNDGHGAFGDVTAASGLDGIPAGSVPIGAVAGDYDNDGAVDLFALRYGRSSLYHNDGKGRFTDVTARVALPAFPYLPGAAAFVDVDHDGDLDLLVAGLADLDATRRLGPGARLFPRQFAPAPVRMWRNNGNSTFTDITRDAGLETAGHAVAIVPTDFDNRRDIDLLIVNRDAPPLLFKNLRDGTFRDVAADVGLQGVVGANEEVAAVATGDINKDDFPDFFFARAGGGVFAISTGRARFTLAPVADAAAADAARLVDYDNDGLLDLLTWTAAGPRVLRNLGRSARDSVAGRWADVTQAAVSGGAAGAVLAAQLGVGDLDGDGNADVLTLGPGGLRQWRNSGDPRHRALRVRLGGQVSNRLGIGSKVELRSGSLGQRLETSAATPAVAPADMVFGVGTREGADVVRVLWPSGVLQAETAPPLAAPFQVKEINRKPSSCPFLFVWNGRRFEFVTDFMGGGEMGAWEGPGQRNRPNPVEYVRIRGDRLQAKDGRYEIRVTNELEEALYADRLQLVALSHPAGVNVFPNEGLTDPPKPFHLFAVRDERVPVRAVDDGGRDISARLARLDRQYPDDFALAPFRGFAARHSLTLDLDAESRSTATTRSLPAASVLLLTGWTDYAFSSDVVAASQAGLALEPPSLAIRDTAGSWRTAIRDIGMPVGRPQTIVVDLTRLLRPGEHEVRLTTNLRIYWDQILVARPADSTLVRSVRLDPRVATLTERGFSMEERPDGREPANYDYDRTTMMSPWKALPGRYTRLGDVRSLLVRPDDMFVIAKAGDEIAVSFDAADAGPVPAGWARTFLLLADGFSKEMDINSGSPDEVEPLPFHGMSRYPYRAPEHYPDSPELTRYRGRDNTRAVIRQLPRLASRIGK